MLDGSTPESGINRMGSLEKQGGEPSTICSRNACDTVTRQLLTTERSRRRYLALLGVSSLVASTGCTVTDILDDDSRAYSDEESDIVNSYNDGQGHFNDGEDDWAAGIPLFNEESYDEATDAFDGAYDHFETAVDAFSSAQSTAEEIARGDVVEEVALAVDAATLMVDATSGARRAASLAADGGSAGEVNAQLGDAEDDRAAAADIDFLSPEELDDLLMDG